MRAPHGVLALLASALLLHAALLGAGCEGCVKPPAQDAGPAEGEGEGEEGEGEGEGEPDPRIVAFCELVDQCDFETLETCITNTQAENDRIRGLGGVTCLQAADAQLELLDCMAGLTCVEVPDGAAVQAACPVAAEVSDLTQRCENGEPPPCNEGTEGFGDPCTNGEDEPPCGVFVCNPITGQLVCNDPGKNDCGVCPLACTGENAETVCGVDVDCLGGFCDLDDRAGRVGQPCGEFLCGVGTCMSGGRATQCVGGDIERNVCGGCAEIEEGLSPGDTCSSCDTGVQTCTVDQESLVCHRGRSADNQCGSCDRCVLAHAFMQNAQPQGGYLEPGTLALLEDVGGVDGVQLIFDPLVAGPGACCVPTGLVLLASNPDPYDGAYWALDPEFSDTVNYSPDLLADPVRTFAVPDFIATDLDTYRYVVLVDGSGLLLDPVLAAGELVTGPAP